jgi:hypothetical protein
MWATIFHQPGRRTNDPWRYRVAPATIGAPTRGSSVFDESNIPDAVRVLERREASIWHACQLIDLAAYLRSGGIGSRDRVVCDLDDISHGFAAGWAMMPNSSGPIALQLAPSVLTDASQAAFCLRSAMTSGFDPARDSLADPRLIDELFWF